MTLTTYGALAPKLIENGYVPTSALRVGTHGWQVSDDPAAVVCIPQHGSKCGVADGDKLTLITLNVLVRDANLRTAIVGLLGSHGIKGPVRRDSAGNDAYIVRWGNEYDPPQSEDIELSGVPVFAVGGWTRGSRSDNESATIRCDGEWRGGDLLTTPRAKLPAIEDQSALKTILSAVREVIFSHGAATVAEPDVPFATLGLKSSSPAVGYAPPKMQGGLSGLTAAERAVFQAGVRGTVSHREKARLDRLAANGADAD